MSVIYLPWHIGNLIVGETLISYLHRHCSHSEWQSGTWFSCLSPLNVARWNYTILFTKSVSINAHAWLYCTVNFVIFPKKGSQAVKPQCGTFKGFAFTGTCNSEIVCLHNYNMWDLACARWIEEVLKFAVFAVYTLLGINHTVILLPVYWENVETVWYLNLKTCSPRYLLWVFNIVTLYHIQWTSYIT